MGKQIDWAVIDHMFLGVASSTDSKVTDFVRVSPSTTETTLGFQTMMCSVAWGGLLAGWAGVHWAEEAMVTEIQANVTEGIGGRGAGALDQDLQGRGSDPLAFCDLNADNIFIIYGGGCRRSGMGGDLKGQGNGGGGVGGLWNNPSLSAVLHKSTDVR